MDSLPRERRAHGGYGRDRLGRRALIPGELLMLGGILYRMKDGK